MMDDGIRVALPRGDLRAPLAERLAAVGFAPAGYGEGSRAYRFSVEGRPRVAVRVFSDEDIPIQIALGNYDLGITSRSSIDELVTRYGHDSIVALRALDVGEARVMLAAPAGTTLDELGARRPLRVATTYPHITAQYLNWLRVPDYRLIEVWGQPQAWPPEDADAAVLDVAAGDGTPEVLEREGLEAIAEVHRGSAWLVANRRALGEHDLREALDALLELPARPPAAEGVQYGPLRPTPLVLDRRAVEARVNGYERHDGPLRLAVPDGHAQRHTVEALATAGIAFEGYDEQQAVRRPRSAIEGVTVKVIRPQDMPQAVALGRFDVALTGRDWLATHLAAFPGSPVVELCDLHRSRYRMGAVVSEDVPAENIAEAVAYWRRDDPGRSIRVASEYVELADHYARERHLGRYRVIPIGGASEGFVPDDAEILIEGSETGTTLRANRLRMIDVIMESTNCAIGSTVRPPGARGDLRDRLVERLAAAAPPDDGGGPA
ncbi:MAG: ATP phosphoribosyltransferase [Chloroflexi bacterium]|nr:ATP phosphoribosyltransferase [Chloroflexota bacterium]